MDLKEERAFSGDPKAHWYYIAKGRAIMSLIGHEPARSILDVGAGTGVFSRMMIEKRLAEEAICVDPNYADEWIGARRSDRISFRKQVDSVDSDLVLMIDVIEHVDDDVGLLARYAGLARPGTRFVISAPAFNALWSSHDEFLEHRRRYTLESLQKAVTAAGLEVAEARYFFGAIFPAVAALRLAERAMKGDRPAQASSLKPAPRWLNEALVALHEAERAVLFPVNKVAGVTAFCLAEKPIMDKARAA